MVADSKRVFDEIDAETFADISEEALLDFIAILKAMHTNLINMKESEAET